MKWLWYFLLYSFCGYLLEKAYAAAVRSPHQVRKCFLLLPLCPVYGAALVAILQLPQGWIDSFWGLVVWGGFIATAVEYVTHFLYERLLGVMFWDYSSTKMDLNRRICMPFSIAWGLLSALTVRYVHPWVAYAVSWIPPQVTYAMLLLVVADALFSIRLLREVHDIDLMSIPKLLRTLQEE